jgi:hypothetical protein
VYVVPIASVCCFYSSRGPSWESPASVGFVGDACEILKGREGMLKQPPAEAVVGSSLC